MSIKKITFELVENKKKHLINGLRMVSNVSFLKLKFFFLLVIEK